MMCKRAVFSLWILCLAVVTMTATIIPAQAQTTLGTQDKQFLLNAAAASVAQVKASQLADTKAASDDVRIFAANMFKNHSLIGQDLRDLAKAKDIVLPTEPRMSQQQDIGKLGKLTGAGFDREYARVMGVLASKELVALYSKAAGGAQDGDVKSFAARTLINLQDDSQSAAQLKTATDKR
ncbi:DUF4142 domain-containing protein [Herbaspirillum sp. RTI4]|uniref:DUF4142 domain-containing protein n=1 Tax=Herbaspirillum sp. RTI4 TaxID=3048640 RepID=UPI002AB3E212|nr:DUF4142 domain-containing protein [Herbaspirillum sp. RTI4]MDY7577386.1 DUF4142 domain-containing protein [Herbaspirillum sp. RTI4]MEA9982386.1 DUF4142 domain-containing protein [Herbaspirillum sp. RTI4]